MTVEQATIFLNQMGGKGFIIMTDCKILKIGTYGVVFSIPVNRSEANRLAVSLKNDTYTFRFFREKKDLTFKNIEIIDDLYFDNIRSTFTEITGLDTTFPTFAKR